jgi:hypothetical protein
MAAVDTTVVVWNATSAACRGEGMVVAVVSVLWQGQW